MRNKEKTEEVTQNGDLLSRLLLVFGTALLIIALCIAGYLVWQYIDARLHYSHIQALARPEFNFDDSGEYDDSLENLVFNWDQLREINPDIVAWIIIPKTHIDYPVVQGDDNEYYLSHLYDGSYSSSGAIFADCQGIRTLDAQNNIIYGHIMVDNSMFTDILRYNNQDFFDRHRTVYLCTPQMNYELCVIANLEITEDTPIRLFEFADEDDFQSYLHDMLAAPITAASDLTSNIDSTEALYSLITCKSFNYSTDRVVLCCVPVRSAVPARTQSQE